jgi:hypothetical protein
MHTNRKQIRSPRLLVGDKSSAVDPIVSHSNVTTLEAARDDVPTPQAPQPLVRYPDHRGGFSRVGRLVASRTVKRGRDKGMVIMTIVSMLNQTLTCNSDEVEIVYDHKFKAAPPR